MSMHASSWSSDRRLGLGSASIMSAGFSVLSICFPEQVRELGNTPGMRAILVAHPVAFGPAVLLGGVLSGTMGPARVLLFGSLLLLAGSVATAFALDAMSLVIWRLAQSAGSGLIVPASLALLLRTATSPAVRAARVGSWAGSQALASAAGMALAAIAADALGWRMSYAIFGGLCACISGVSAVVTNTRRVALTLFPLRSFLVASLSLATFTFFLSRFQDTGSASALVMCLLAAVASYFCVRIDQRRLSGNLIPPGILRSRSYRIGLGGISLFGAAFLGNFFLSAFVLRTRWNLSLLEVALFTAPVGIAMGLSTGSFARLSSRITHHRVILIAAPAAVFAFVVMSYLVQAAAFAPIAWVIVSIALGVGMGGSMPSFNASGMAQVAQQDVGIAGSVLQLARQVGGGVGVALIVQAIGIASPSSFSKAYLCLAAFALAGAILAGWYIAEGESHGRPSMDKHVARPER